MRKNDRKKNQVWRQTNIHAFSKTFATIRYTFIDEPSVKILSISGRSNRFCPHKTKKTRKFKLPINS